MAFWGGTAAAYDATFCVQRGDTGESNIRVETRGGKNENIASITFPVFLIIADCFAQQRFRSEPSYTEVNPSSDAVLKCMIENVGGECRWQKDGKVSNKDSAADDYVVSISSHLAPDI